MNAGLMEPLTTPVAGDHVPVLRLSASAKHPYYLQLFCFLFDGPLLARKIPHLPI